MPDVRAAVVIHNSIEVVQWQAVGRNQLGSIPQHVGRHVQPSVGEGSEQ